MGLGWVGSTFCSSGWVSHLWFGFRFGKFPLKVSNFSVFSPRVKKKYLRVVSKSTRVKGGKGLLFTAGQKYALVGLSQGPSLLLAQSLKTKGQMCNNMKKKIYLL